MKVFILSLLSFILFMPVHSFSQTEVVVFTINQPQEKDYSQSFGVVLSGFYYYMANSDFNDTADDFPDYIRDIWSGFASKSVNAEGFNSLMGGEIEFQIYPIPPFMIGLGIGYAASPTVKVTDSYSDPGPGTWDEEIESKFTCFPLSLSGYYIVDISQRLSIYPGIGLEYYFGTLSYNEKKRLNDGIPQFLSQGDYLSSGMGVALKLTGEYRLLENVSLLLGFSGRIARISGFEDDVIQQDGTVKKEKFYSYDYKTGQNTYHLMGPFTSDEIAQLKSNPNVSNVEETAIILSGIRISFGVGFYF